MSALEVRELPEDVYRGLQRLAEFENRSLAQEAVVLHRKALEIETSHQKRRERLLETLRHNDPVDTRDLAGKNKLTTFSLK